jgi:proline iminopeptidase
VRGIFMLRRWELEWFYQGGCHRLLPGRVGEYLRRSRRSERAT